jgi:FKBP-type peptidyl-prolyl cis-trans isomerase SlyD
MSSNLKVENGLVVSMKYTLHVDGELVDESDQDYPLEFIQGEGMIIPGLEQALYGLKVGESKAVEVAAKDGYGELDEDAYSEVPRSDFPADIPLEEGVELEVEDEDGSLVHATIESFSEDIVRLDYNHPLAGFDLSFIIEIVGLRAATPEELDHGHVHELE